MESELLAQGYRKYSGEAIDVFFNTSICVHSGNCVRGNKEIFNLDRRPWVLPDNAEAQEVMRVINTCPSGALKYVQH
ncbi:(4Fe-4S)-binding protein [Vagococcus sp. BWB3-3]|uniref:(4Fe-4S)-binding protein n=1 Tax=Vagococcus allomyrinae TaxID=2794353 RepID=A0A940P9V6_9ENTE|nr:(4Fe-4S)-binding protein [Vagococcus allomyrinae]MBP1043987.1 (4Fe-4S)-binding protein [Vagococcus allomyrinae]